MVTMLTRWLAMKMVAKVRRLCRCFIRAVARRHGPAQLEWHDDQQEDGNPTTHATKCSKGAKLNASYQHT